MEFAGLENDLATRAQDITLYVRFAAVFVVAIGVLQLWQGFRDAAYVRLLVGGAVAIVGVLTVMDPAFLLDRV